MSKRLMAIGIAAALAGCAATVEPPDTLQNWQSKTLYTCCNIHYERDEIVDVNYYVGNNLAFGSPAAVQATAKDSITFQSGATTLTLLRYGNQPESFWKYASKLLVEADPHMRFQTFAPKVQEAITKARVERGMTREQVLMSLGYPPTQRTASLEQATWTYSYDRFVTYTVTFDDKGKVSEIAGTDAPTRNQPIPDGTEKPKPAAKPKAKKK